MRPIDADKIVFHYGGLSQISPMDFAGTAEYFSNQIKEVPELDYDELVPRGVWIDKGWDGDFSFQIDWRGNCWRVFECSLCGKESRSPSPYCQHCGAKMSCEDTIRKRQMVTPFENDPFSMVWAAFKNLYPDKECEVFWDQHQKDEHEEEYGFTSFPVDGSDPQVIIFAEHPVNTQTETFAHELAHVAVGPEHEHDEVWKAAFDAIFNEYNRLGDSMFEGENEKSSGEEGNYEESSKVPLDRSGEADDKPEGE